MSDWDYGRPTDEQYQVPRPSWPDGTSYPYPLPFPLAQAVDDDPLAQAVDDETGPARGFATPAGGWPPVGGRPENNAAREPVPDERDQFAATAPQPAVRPPGAYHPWPPAPRPAWLGNAPDPGDPPAPGSHRKQAGRRWLIPAGVVAGAAGLGAVAVLVTGGHPSATGASGAASPSATPSMAVRVSKSPAPSALAGPPLTQAQAQAVVAGYTTANNSANAQRSDAALAAVETGSSDAIDAGLYQEQEASGTAPYPAFSPVQATYYIPGGEPAGGPRWFVVQVANAFQSSPGTVTSDEYLLFTQSAAGGAWLNAIEPYLLAGTSAPQIAVGADGLASAVSPDAATVAVTPGQLPAATAASLDGTTNPGNLADRADQKLWQGKVPGGTVTDAHTAAAGADGQEFALRTTDGGALVFYTDAAEVTITPPAGSLLHLTVPGFYSPGQALSRAGVSYLEQFASYDPPAGRGSPHIVADYSGITGKN